MWSALRKAPVSVFVKTIDGLYSFDLKSGRATKFPITIEFYSTTSLIVPYVSFNLSLDLSSIWCLPLGLGMRSASSC